MDLQAQEKAAKIIREQADKLAIAMKALRQIRRFNIDTAEHGLQTAVDIASDAILEISVYGKNPEDL